MKETELPKDTGVLSVEKIVELIRAVRNDLIKEFLNDEVLNQYFRAHFKRDLSNVKREFLKRDLKEMLIAPVDLVHYSKLITHVKDTGAFSLVQKNDDFFYSDVHSIISKYSF
ncbi:MAG TPA: hypothetical protein VGD40_23240 [Chryseosolibacter sp.]